MSLLTKLLKKFKYEEPEIKYLALKNKDILTLSGEATLDEELDPVETNNFKVELGGANVADVYPNGLPSPVLKQVNFKIFGKMLKQRQLLPPSYDRNPSEVIILTEKEIPTVQLVFNSKTTPAYWTVFIKGYYVSAAKSSKVAFEHQLVMSEVWREFVGKIMWAFERNIICSEIQREDNHNN